MYDEADDKALMEDPELAGLTRWVPPVVVGGVVLAFVALAWYAYHAGTESVKEDDLMVVEADKTPIKEKPADPGGMQFPNQDKTVFETFAGNMQQPPKVETVLPAPEEPMPKEAAEETTTWINDKLHKSGDADKSPASAKPEQVIGEDEKKPDALPLAPVVTMPITMAVPTPASAASVPKMTQAARLAPPEPVPDVAPKAPVAPPQESAKAPAVKPQNSSRDAGKVKATGKITVQLGAYRSDKEAHDAWNRMLKKNDALSDSKPMIVKASIGDRGVYFRLRVGGFGSNAEAKEFCGKLIEGGQACIPVAK